MTRYFLMYILLMTLSIVVPSCGKESKITVRETPVNAAVAKISGGRLDKVSVAKILENVGFPKKAIPAMVCVAHYESGFTPKTFHKNSDGSNDYGMFQINDYWWAGSCGVKKSSELYDPKVNAKCALKVFRRQGIEAWAAYRKNRKTCDHYVITSSKRT